MDPLSISELARAAGVHTETVRYYERRGLIPSPPRSGAGYRQYSPETARRVQFIKRAQALGFMLDEIQGLLTLRVAPGRGGAAVEREARRVIGRSDGRVGELQRMKGALARLAQACHDRTATDECPILDALDEGDTRASPTVELVYLRGCPHVESARDVLRPTWLEQPKPGKRITPRTG
jgi:DNA-binding transcriptional MerR regulator